jgi:hypothetical protein
MGIISRGLCAAGIWGALAASAAAQDYAGQWRCEMVNRSATNNAFENWMYSFGLTLYPNGGFEAQGQYFAQTNGFNMPFYARGQWQQAQGGISLMGQEQREGYNGPFRMLLTYYGPGSMSYRFTGAGGTMAMACQQ